MADFNKRQKELNALPAVDYEPSTKPSGNIFISYSSKKEKKYLVRQLSTTFFESNKEWLQPYAVFSYLRDVYKTAQLPRVA